MLAIVKEAMEPGIKLVNKTIRNVDPGEVMIKIAATGICGSDVHVYEWTSGYEWVGQYMPVVLGHEFSGVVCEIGKDVGETLLGKKVVVMPGVACGRCANCINGHSNRCGMRKSYGLYMDGSLAEYVVVRAENCLEIGDTDLKVAALAEPLAIAVNAIRLAKLSLSDTVLITGPGPIGLMMTMLARKSGVAHVILAGMRNDAERLETGRELGADMICMAEDGGPADIVRELTNGAGVSVVLEASGSGHAVIEGISLLRKGGRMALVGIHSRKVELDLNLLVRQEKQLFGAYGSSPKDWLDVLQILKTEEEKLKLLITHSFPLTQAEEALKTAAGKKAIKVVVETNNLPLTNRR